MSVAPLPVLVTARTAKLYVSPLARFSMVYFEFTRFTGVDGCEVYVGVACAVVGAVLILGDVVVFRVVPGKHNLAITHRGLEIGRGRRGVERFIDTDF